MAAASEPTNEREIYFIFAIVDSNHAQLNIQNCHGFSCGPEQRPQHPLHAVVFQRHRDGYDLFRLRISVNRRKKGALIAGLIVLVIITGVKAPGTKLTNTFANGMLYVSVSITQKPPFR